MKSEKKRKKKKKYFSGKNHLQGSYGGSITIYATEVLFFNSSRRSGAEKKKLAYDVIDTSAVHVDLVYDVEHEIRQNGSAHGQVFTTFKHPSLTKEIINRPRGRGGGPL